MEKIKITIVWTIYQDEGYWKYAYGNKQRTIVHSKRIMTKEMARKQLNEQIDRTKRQYNDTYIVELEELTF